MICPTTDSDLESAILMGNTLGIQGDVMGSVDLLGIFAPEVGGSVQEAGEVHLALHQVVSSLWCHPTWLAGKCLEWRV